MSQGIKIDDPPARKAAGIMGHLFGRSEHKTPGLDLDDIQGFILRGYRMPMVRHFLLTVGVPRRPASYSDGSLAAMSRMRRRSRRLKNGR